MNFYSLLYKSNDGRLFSRISPFYLGLCSILDCSFEDMSCRVESDVDFVLFLHRNGFSDILLNVFLCFFFLEMSWKFGQKLNHLYDFLHSLLYPFNQLVAI